MEATATYIDGREEYSLYLSRPFKLAVSIYFVFLTLSLIGMLVCILFLLMISLRPSEKVAFAIFFMFMLSVTVWLWYWLLSIPHKILLAPDGNITFISILRRKDMNVGEISSIKPEQTNIGFLFVRSSRGNVRLLNQFDQFHEFIA